MLRDERSAASSSPEVLLVVKMLDSLAAAKRALEEMRKQIEEFVAAERECSGGAGPQAQEKAQ